MERTWRDAKMPQWARDSVQEEIDQWRLTAALSWPTEAKPEPLPFSWGEYDQLRGEPVAGSYYTVSGSSYISRFSLARVSDLDADDMAGFGGQGWKRWAFRSETGNGKWTTNVVRGPLFDSERDASLYWRWTMCEEFARKLLAVM